MASSVVYIKQGQLRGTTLTNIDGEEFHAFLGIPYAKPPLGDLRFKAPVPIDPWDGIKDATKEGNPSYARDDITHEIRGSEDCLYLNVFTRELPPSSNKLRPVMVWIHGGGFIFGSSSISIYGPGFLMTEDIVFVSINYRLGVLGFLSIEDPSLEVPGNAGLKDQVLALKWVQENIKYFNGDPNNVTIFGESAGAASVHFHVLSQSSRGLFHKAILQSGSVLSYWALGLRVAKEIVGNLGYTAADDREALDILKKTPVDKLFEAQEKTRPELTFYPCDHRTHSPVIEKPNDTAFLLEKPIDIVTSGRYNKVPMLMGYNTKEGLFMIAYSQIVQERSKIKVDKLPSLENYIPSNVNIEKGSEESLEIVKKIKNLYFPNQEPSTLFDYTELITDSVFFSTTMAAVKNHLETSKNPVYLYRMSIDSGLNFYKNITKLQHIPGTSHCDDLGYLFTSVATPEIKPGSLEDISFRKIVKLWTNFARNGNPTPVKEEFGVTWKPVEKERTYFLDIGKDLVLKVNPDPERLALWREIFRHSSNTSKFL